VVSNENFKLKTIPKLNPLGREYFKWWKEQKRLCIEGYWSGGKWMPGNLYFYINFWKIQLNKDEHSKTKIIASPFLRDIEWELAYYWMETRGFSGFELDDEYSCYRGLETTENETASGIILLDDPEPTFNLPKSCFKKDGALKKYIPARDYLRKIHKGDLGRPLFENEAKNMMMIGSRGFGKSYFVAGAVIAHQFLMDGATWHWELLESKKTEQPMTTEVLVGAGDAKYSNDLLAKVKLGLDEIPGDMMLNGETHPSPLKKAYSGSWKPADMIIAEYEKKIGGEWQTLGSRSKIQHRSFNNDEFAGNGTRPSVYVIEECGFCPNIEGIHGAMAESTANGSVKFGSGLYLGTGGDMDGGGTVGTKKMFYDPDAYDLISTVDIWENKGKIGIFVPATKGLNKYKDKEGNTNEEAALKHLLKVRETKKKASSKDPLNKELQNRPLKPSEAFLVLSGNIFPVADLQNQLGFVEASTDGNIVGTSGELIIDENGKVKFEPDLKKKLIPCDFPVASKDDTTGCVVIWEHPEMSPAPYGYYLAGTDPYDQDKAPNSVSLGSTFIMKRATPGLSTRDQIVAEYTARPATAEQHHEIVRRLMVYYTGLDLYENEKNTLKMHFKNMNSLHYLAYTPTILKATKDSNVDRTYGIHMTNSIKSELEIYTRDWLITPVGDGKLNLHFIYSKPLLKELIAYNEDGNFDRVIALMLCVCNKMNFAKLISKRKEEIKRDNFFDRQLFITKRTGWQ
jgi:hypothetical protein